MYNLNSEKKMKFFIKDFFSKCEDICRKLRICSHLQKESLMEHFIFCAALNSFCREAPFKNNNKKQK